MPREPGRMHRRALAPLLAIIPALALTLAIPFVNRLEPRVLGLPFLVAWIILWMLLTPLFLWAVYKLEPRS